MNTDTEVFRLVRVQDDLHGMHVDAHGNLILHRAPRGYNRNTAHFALNGTVPNHAYTFKPFDGQIGIIADPRQVKGIPSGFRQEDIWFHHDADDDLNIGPALLVAPTGTALPPGANAVFFDPTVPDARNQAITAELKRAGVTVRDIGMWSWNNWNAGTKTPDEWRYDTLTALYGNDIGKIQGCTHDASLDKAVDDSANACEGMIAMARENYLYQTSEGVEYPTTTIVAEFVASARANIVRFQSEAHPAAVTAAGPYLHRLGSKIDLIEAENEAIRKRFELPYFVVPYTGAEQYGPYSYEQMESMVTRQQIMPAALVKDIRQGEGYETARDRFAQLAWPVIAPPPPPPLPSLGRFETPGAAIRALRLQNRQDIPDPPDDTEAESTAPKF